MMKEYKISKIGGIFSRYLLMEKDITTGEVNVHFQMWYKNENGDIMKNWVDTSKLRYWSIDQLYRSIIEKTNNVKEARENLLFLLLAELPSDVRVADTRQSLFGRFEDTRGDYF